MESRTIAGIEIIVLEYEMEIPPGGSTWVISYWVCAAGFSEPLSYFSLDPIFVRCWARPEWIGSRLLNIKIRLQLFYHESSS